MADNKTVHMETDLVVLGGGPAGHAAALEAARLGLRAVLVEREHLGGTCLNWGCIPTKLFLGATTAVAELESSAKLKLAQGEIRYDLIALQARKERLLEATRKALTAQLADAHVTFLSGTGRAVSMDVVEVETTDGERTRVHFTKLVIATGSHPAAFAGMEPDGDAVLNSNHALTLTTPPESLLIIGGGAIGLEMADFFSRLGARITLVEGLDRLAPTEDGDMGKTLERILKRRKYTILTGERVASLKTEDGRARLVLESGKELEAEKALVAVGRLPNTGGLGLDRLGVATRGPGWIVTDERLRAAPGICAVGDVNGITLLAHAAMHQARYAVRLLIGDTDAPYDPTIMPVCIYGHTEVMRAGPTLRELQDAGHEVFASSAQLAANPIAQAAGATQGVVKALWVRDEDGTRRVRSLCAVGHGVSHLVTQAQLIVAHAWTADDAHAHIFAHPTLDEALEAALTGPTAPVPARAPANG